MKKQLWCNISVTSDAAIQGKLSTVRFHRIDALISGLNAFEILLE